MLNCLWMLGGIDMKKIIKKIKFYFFKRKHNNKDYIY